MFVVFRCVCGRHLYARRDAKTRACPCGKRVDLSSVRILAEAEDAPEAGEMVRALQSKGRVLGGFHPARL